MAGLDWCLLDLPTRVNMLCEYSQPAASRRGLQQHPWNLPQLWSHRWTGPANDWAVLESWTHPLLPNPSTSLTGPFALEVSDGLREGCSKLHLSLNLSANLLSFFLSSHTCQTCMQSIYSCSPPPLYLS